MSASFEKRYFKIGQVIVLRTLQNSSMPSQHKKHMKSSLHRLGADAANSRYNWFSKRQLSEKSSVQESCRQCRHSEYSAYSMYWVYIYIYVSVYKI